MSEPKPIAERRGLARRARGPLLTGALVLLAFLGGFGAWATLAPLAAGAIAHGIISPEGSQRTVQHLEGGILAAILVRDGDVVAKGQPLVVFEEIAARSQVDMLLNQRWVHQANLARITAEDLDEASIKFLDDLEAARHDNADVLSLLASQEHLFETRRDQLTAQRQMLHERIDQIAEEIHGLEAQVDSATRQLEIISEEIADKVSLVGRNLMPKPQLLALQRLEAEIRGDRGEYEADIARARQQISETELQLVGLAADRANANAKDRDERLAKLAEIDEQLAASEDVLKRTVIVSPAAGTVLNLRFKTEGGVVQPGEEILRIVPSEDELVIEARIAPNDIDVVEPGLEAKVHLLAFSNRSTPMVSGIVRTVAADIVTEPETGDSYYLAKIEVDRRLIEEQLGQDTPLVPGMPADVLIVSTERTFLNYLVKPFQDAFNRSFREL